MPNAIDNSHQATACDLRGKAARLFTYLKEVCRLRFVMVRDCRNYDQVLWFHEIPHERECFCIAWSGPTETQDSWIEVRRSAEPVCPPVPTACADWVSPGDLRESSQSPVLRERILLPNPEGESAQYSELAQQPEVSVKWQEYLTARWEP